MSAWFSAPATLGAEGERRGTPKFTEMRQVGVGEQLEFKPSAKTFSVLVRLGEEGSPNALLNHKQSIREGEVVVVEQVHIATNTLPTIPAANFYPFVTGQP